MPSGPMMGSSQTTGGHTGAPVPFPMYRVPAMRPAVEDAVKGAIANGPAAKVVRTQEDVEAFKGSDAEGLLIGFVLNLNEAVKGKSHRDCLLENQSPAISRLLAMLDRVNEIITAHPPEKTEGRRYGNPAFRQFYAALVKEAPTLLAAALSDQAKEAAVEVVPYLTEAFGNDTRIDYGSGHELTFFALLVAFERLGQFTRADYLALVLHVFTRYLKVTRRVQTSYWMEPAGSRGVWGLDDYHFLPFLFGAGQLVGHPAITPANVLDEAVREKYAGEWLYVAAVDFIFKVKTGPFGEHSPTLYSLTNAPHWQKINGGMMKMWVAEVLHKRPVLQHFLFGSLIRFSPGSPTVPLTEKEQESVRKEAAAAGQKAEVDGTTLRPTLVADPSRPALPLS